MKRDDLFPGKYLKASDIPPAGFDLTITGFAVEELGDAREKKGVAHFHEVDKGLVLNRTNWDAIALLLGDDTDGWVRGWIGLTTVPVTFRGETKPAIRVRAPRTSRPAKAAAPPPAREADDDWPDDELTGS